MHLKILRKYVVMGQMTREWTKGKAVGVLLYILFGMDYHYGHFELKPVYPS